MQKWNIPMDSAQRVDEKNGAICLVIIFTPGVMVIKMSKMAHFLYFQQTTGKNQSQFGQNTCIWKIFVALSENALEFRDLLLTQQFFHIPTLDISRTVTPKPYYFLTELKKIFQVHLNVFPRLTNFCCHQQKIQKMNHFWYFNDHNSGNKHDN